MEVYTLELKDFSNVTELGMEHQILSKGSQEYPHFKKSLDF